MNISIEDQNGNLKSTYQLFTEISDKLKDLKGSELASASNNLFGKQNISSALALVQNIEKAKEVLETTKTSVNSVDKEFDRYLNSTSAKITQLKENMGGLYNQFLNSDMTKGTVDGLNLLVTSITSVISKLGAFPSTIASVVGALTIFNSKFRDSLGNYTNSIPIIGSVNTKLLSLKNSYDKQIIAIKSKITAQKTEIAIGQQLGVSTASSSAKLALYQTQLIGTTMKTIACNVASTVLQATLSMGLSLAITGAITLLSSFWGVLTSTGLEMNDCSEQAKALSESLKLESDTETLLTKYKALNDLLKDSNTTEEQKKKINTEIMDIKDKLISLDDSYGWILKDQNKTYDEQLTLLKGIYEQKLKENAEKLDDKMSSQHKANNVGEELEKNVALIKEYENALKNTNTDGTINWRGGVLKADTARETLEKLKESVKDGYITIQEYNHDVEQLEQANYKSGRSTISLKKNVDEVVSSLINQNKTTEKTTYNNQRSAKSIDLIAEAQEELKNNQMVSQETIDKLNEAYPELGMTIENASEKLGGLNEETEENNNLTKEMTIAEKYSEAVSKIDEAKAYIEELNEAQSMTPELIKKISSAYPEIGSSILSVGSTIDYINEQLRNQADIAEQVYEQMVYDDKEFYQNKIANNSEFQNVYNDFLNSWLSDGKGAYDVDLKNYTTLGELKEKTQNDLGIRIENWLRQFVKSGADGYADDYNNFKSFAEAKAEVLKRLQEQIDKVTKQMNNAIDKGNELSSKYQYSDPSDKTHKTANANYVSDMANQLDKLNEAYDKVETNFDGISGQMQGFSGGTIGTTGGSSSNDSKKSGKSDAEKAQEQLEKFKEQLDNLNMSKDDLNRYDSYNDKLKDLSNALDSISQAKSRVKEGSKEYIELEKQEIELMKQKSDETNNLKGEYEKRAKELRDYLSKYQFTFDESGNMTNSYGRLSDFINTLNSMNDATEEGVKKKQEYKEWIDKLKESTSEYSNIIHTEIPQCKKEMEELGSSIQSINTENLEKVVDKIASALGEKLKKAKEKALDAIEIDKNDSLKAIDEQIQDLQDKIDALDETTDDKKAKLKELIEERQRWQSVNTNNVDKSEKISGLDEKIEELQKDIKKDDLNSQKEQLEKKKDNESSYYDDLKKETEDSYDDMLKDENIYLEAQKMLMSGNMDEITKLIKGYSTDFDKLGLLLGSSFNTSFMSQVQQCVDFLKGVNGITGNKTSLGNTSSVTSKPTISSNGNLNGGSFYVDSKGNIANNQEELLQKIGHYRTGGKIGEIEDGEGLAYVGKNERVLTENQDNKLDEIYLLVNEIKNSDKYNINALPTNYLRPTLQNSTNMNNTSKYYSNNTTSEKIEINNEFNTIIKEKVQLEKTPENINDIIAKQMGKYNKFNQYQN